MTDGRAKKRRRLAYEILGFIGISALLAAIVFLVLSWTAGVLVENYCFEHDVVMTEFDWLTVDRRIFSISGILSAAFFSVLFLALLAERMAYIRTLTKGIDILRLGHTGYTIPLSGNNELTELADAINYMSATQQQLREKELTLSREKEQLIRTLSHDIRTPLTSILAYSEYLSGENELSGMERKAHLQMIRKKAEQIRDLTELLLDGGKRNLEQFADAHLLIEQLAAEFEEELEERFAVSTDLSGCPSFPGTFDVQELRRIFDNLSSNVQKYADSDRPVCLSLCVDGDGMHITQTNGIRAETGPADSYKLGINSIRRIAQYYGGRVTVRQDTRDFAIEITLSDF